MFQNHFYHESIKRVITVFGSLFNNLAILKKDQSGNIVDQLKVPLSYAPKDKILARLEERPDLDNAQMTAITLPRMSFEMVDLSYDNSTKLNKMDQFVHKNIIDNDDIFNTKSKKTYSYAPYNLTIQLNIMVKNSDDGLQIIEQILPYFQPTFTVTIKQIPDMESLMDVPFTLTSISVEDNYEGDYTTRRAMIYTLIFSCKVRFFGPITQQGIIKKAIANIKDKDSENLYEKITVEAVETGSPTNDYYIITTYEDFFDELMNGQ